MLHIAQSQIANPQSFAPKSDTSNGVNRCWIFKRANSQPVQSALQYHTGYNTKGYRVLAIIIVPTEDAQPVEDDVHCVRLQISKYPLTGVLLILKR